MATFSGFVILVGEANHQQNQTSVHKYMSEDVVQMILGACYLHAESPSPVQDLVDIGFLSADFAGDTCTSVKQGSEEAQKIKGHAEFARSASDSYNECLEKQVDCWDIIREFCANPAYARYIVQDCQGMTEKRDGQ